MSQSQNSFAKDSKNMFFLSETMTLPDLICSSAQFCALLFEVCPEDTAVIYFVVSGLRNWT